MNDKFITELRAIGGGMQNAVVSDVTVYKGAQRVVINIICDKVFSDDEKLQAKKVAQKYVPSIFKIDVYVKKLTPDEEMVKTKILQILSYDYAAVAATLMQDEVEVQRLDDGFVFTIYLMDAVGNAKDILSAVTAKLKSSFCGVFRGEVKSSKRTTDDLTIEEDYYEEEFVTPIRTFEICNFSALEGGEVPTRATYLSDLNYVSNKVVVCGRVEYIDEKTYKNKAGDEKVYFSLGLSDNTATMQGSYFVRQASVNLIRKIKEGDWIVANGKTEIFRGSLRFTITRIDYGEQSRDFVIEKLPSKPAPKFYKTVQPQSFEDMRQGDFFAENYMPDCLKEHEFVVFDLETTGLNSTPATGNMDRIIEIGAYKIKNGLIKESFSTFVNPEKILSEEIVKLTGITQEMVKDAPKYEDVMPDFYKFCQGSILVGHNIAGFDFKFVEYYCAKCGYTLERKIMDTIPLAQSQLYLANYKLNTIADYFKIVFNHHRAVDDALVTAQIFIELIKLKKSLPRLS